MTSEIPTDNPTTQLQVYIARFDQVNAHISIMTSSFFEVLSDDLLVSIFVFIFAYGNRYDGCNFAITCRRFKYIFGKDGPGYILFKNYKSSFLTPFASSNIGKLRSVETNWFTKQYKREHCSAHMASNLVRADSHNVLHCANECCLDSRKAFNNERSNSCTIKSMATLARLVSSAINDNGDEVHYLYNKARGSEEHVICRRVYKTGRLVDKVILRIAELLSDFHTLIGMKASLDGEFLAFDYMSNQNNGHSQPLMKIAIWDYKLDSMKHIECDLQLNPVNTTARTLSYGHYWWVSGQGGEQHLLTTCEIFFYRDNDGHRVLKNGFAILDHSTDPPTIKLPFQLTSILHSYFSGWRGVIFHRYTHGGFSASVYDFEHGPDHIRVYNLSSSTNPCSMVASASHEMFHHPYSTCISSDGQHVVVLCASCTHSYSFPVTKHNDSVNTRYLMAVHFTKSPNGNYFYRRLAAKDELYFSYQDQGQAAFLWDVSMSPCNSILYIVNKMNNIVRYGANANQSAFFAKISNDGLSQLNPIANGLVRQITWIPNCMTIMLKYGAVFLRPRIQVL